MSDREGRAKLLEAVTRRGFIDDYSGIRISKTGRRFKISRATIWNLLTEDGKPCGQAAMFTEWKLIRFSVQNHALSASLPKL
jgi:predicted DNA-binding protein (UPF0251 family)